jgi:hypothetical protein
MMIYTVTTLTDENDAGATVNLPGGTGLSLREAIALANAGGGADVITFAAALSGGLIRLTGGVLAITDAAGIIGDLDRDGRPDITITGDKNGDDALIAGTNITDVSANTNSADNTAILRASAALSFSGLTLTGATFSAVSVVQATGAALEINHAVLSGNTGLSGGAVASDVALWMSDTTVSHNSATFGGGGVAAFLGSAAFTNVTFLGNTAGSGGGLDSGGADVTLTNVTFAANHASSAGGAINAIAGTDSGPSSLSLVNVTISGNSAGSGPGGVIVTQGGTLALLNSIVTGNSGADVDVSDATQTLFGGNVIGTNVFNGNIDVGDTTAAIVFAATQDIGGGVRAGVLADNGGLVPTIALKRNAANPAIDAGEDNATGVPAADARGVAHADFPGVANNGANVSDLGAFDLGNAPVIVLKPTLDVVTENFSVLLGDGAGGFTAADDLAVGTGARAAALGDIDSDGDLDIVTANPDSDNVSVLLGDGAGGFAAAYGFAVGNGPRALALGDLDGDGDLDIVTADRLGDTVSVLLGDGAGGFTALASGPIAIGAGPQALALGDVDGDGDLDIVAASFFDSRVSVLLGDGSGSFIVAGTPVVPGGSPSDVRLGDVDGDGALDIVTANELSDSVSVLLGDGSGGFAAPAGSSLIAAGHRPESVALGDLDGDGDLDIVTANENTNRVTVLLGDGAGGFAQATGSPITIGDGPFAVTLGDVDADGDLDLITANDRGDTVSVLLGNGTGGFTPAPGNPFAVAALRSVALGDVNPLSETSLTDELAFAEGELKRLLPRIMVADPDGATLASATLTIGGGFVGSGDVLTAVTIGTGIAASFDAGMGVLSLTGTASIADYVAVLRSVTFGSGDDPTHGGANTSRTLSLTVDDGSAGGVSIAATITLGITSVNDAPTDIALSGARVMENAADGTVVGSLSAVDPDADGSTTFTLLDDAGGRFTISGNNLVVANGVLIDYEQDASHAVVVKVVDSGGLSVEKTFVVDVTNVPGSPDDGSVTAPAGNSQFEGGGGIDTITFGFRLVDATVTYSSAAVIIDGPGGSHTALAGFERFVFIDGTVDNADGSPLIDDLFYYSQNHDVWNAHVDADLHYNATGWHEGRDPNAFFDTSLYLSANPDVAAAGINPLNQFDAIGWREARVPSLAFDPRQYLAANPDVAAAHIDPLWHFLGVGASEGRLPFDAAKLIAANGFDFVYYLRQNPDVAAADVDPLWHFQTTGWKEGRNPNALFDTAGYLSTYTDVAAAQINPLDHYNQFGWHEGRDPSVNFGTSAYLAAYADVAAAHVNPLNHFLYIGQDEGRSPLADGAWG